jgi:DnaK suppressor protein
MTRDQQHSFKSVLETLRSEIEAQLAGGSGADDSIRPDNAIGRLTRMEAIQAQSISSAGKVRLKKRLPQIERALKAIDEGTYGTCTSCGEDIPAGRLEIRPESRLCVGCASR